MIYYIQAKDGGPIKIGYTRYSAESRLAAFQIGCPVKLIILATHSGSSKREKEIHGIFDLYRTHGEWFWYSSKLADYIEQNATHFYWLPKDGDLTLEYLPSKQLVSP